MALCFLCQPTNKTTSLIDISVNGQRPRKKAQNWIRFSERKQTKQAAEIDLKLGHAGTERQCRRRAQRKAREDFRCGED